MTATFSQLCKEVGEWSEENFGDQGGLNEFAPFLGIAEEIMVERVQNISAGAEAIKDAFSDAFIYFADFCYRRGIDTQGWEFNWSLTVKSSMTVCYGCLARALLKSHQGIRNVTEDDVQDAAKNLFESMVQLYYIYDVDLSDAVWSTWEETVKKRNWKANPITGTTNA